MAKMFSTAIAILWGVVIIGFTLQEGSQSSELSQGVTRLLFNHLTNYAIFSRYFDFPLFHTTVRALAHVIN